MADGNDLAADVYVSIGSNIQPERNLRLACRELEARYGKLSLSHVYRSAAVGFKGDDFLNMVVGFHTSEKPAAIIEHMERIHIRAERVRLSNPFSPRTLDLDVLLYGDAVHAELKIPHDDIEDYAFVLRPLSELAPALRHPVTGKRIRDMWNSSDQRHTKLTQVDLEIEPAELELS